MDQPFSTRVIHSDSNRHHRTAFVQRAIVNISALMNGSTLSARHQLSCPGSTLLRYHVRRVCVLCVRCALCVRLGWSDCCASHTQPHHCVGTGVPRVSLPGPTSVPSDAQQDGIGDRAQTLCCCCCAANCACSEVESVLICACDHHYTCYRNHRTFFRKKKKHKKKTKGKFEKSKSI